MFVTLRLMNRKGWSYRQNTMVKERMFWVLAGTDCGCWCECACTWEWCCSEHCHRQLTSRIWISRFAFLISFLFFFAQKLKNDNVDFAPNSRFSKGNFLSAKKRSRCFCRFFADHPKIYFWLFVIIPNQMNSSFHNATKTWKKWIVNFMSFSL